jgi:hypothetical protein
MGAAVNAQQRFRLWLGGAQAGLGLGLLIGALHTHGEVWWVPGAFLVGAGIFTTLTWRMGQPAHGRSGDG